MGVRALVPVGENRWMAPKDVRLIPTLYQRGSKNGLRRLSGALQTFPRVSLLRRHIFLLDFHILRS
jgi:hypothetical protein